MTLMTDEELKRLFDAMRQENAAAHVETRQHVDSAVDEMRQESATGHVETRRHVDGALDQMRQESATGHVETRRHVDGALDQMRQENAVAHLETRRHFDVSIQRLEKRFDLLAEALAGVDERLDSKTADLEEGMERGFAETQAMIKFSHAELDRRVRALEEGFADLQGRVERLEGSTH